MDVKKDSDGFALAQQLALEGPKSIPVDLWKSLKPSERRHIAEPWMAATPTTEA
jgi:hypothetical protein